MNPIKVLRDEHEAIKVELAELEFIMGDAGCAAFKSEEKHVINYSNLIHTFWKLCKLWENHEEMEEEIFKVMDEEGFAIPIESISLEHESLRGRVKRITEAINSGSDFEVRRVLCKEMREFVDVLRKHAEDEEDVLSGVLLGEFSDKGLGEIRRIIGKYQ